MINHDILRDYEVSIWTLQDNCITILKHSKTENKGQIQDPDFRLKNDGTLTFSFSLPMYLYQNGEKKENPIWFNTRNGNIIVDLRKIKVIFNPETSDIKVFEFLITKVTEAHEGFQLICQVECEGLAFHELGKIGYKISLNENTYIDEWNNWFENDGAAATEPHNNINYWCDKIFVNTNWSYEICMDWSSEDGIITNYTELSPLERQQLNNVRETNGLRRCDKIYEDAYTSSWKESNGILTPTGVVDKKEKERLIEVEESNIYNITQTIAETFGVFCEYYYEHDANYYITNKKVIFYNNFLQESTGAIDINYSYDTANISREMDSKDCVSKMYVKTLEDSNTESGFATIMDTEANRSGEDYLLNFDYLYSIGSITEEQYDEIKDYELTLHNINEQLKLYENQLISYSDRLILASSEETVAKNAIALDNERISATNDLLNSITNNTGIVVIDGTRPDFCTAIDDNNGRYYINLRQKGIMVDTIQIFTTYSASTGSLSGQVSTYELEYNEFGNLNSIRNILISTWPTSAHVLYVTYSYQPQLYYENIRKVWESRLAKDTNIYNTQHEMVVLLNASIESITNQQKQLLATKEQIVKRFERLMGPAMREGYWQPDDIYAKYGEKHKEDFIFSNSAQFDDNLASMGWDNNLFEDELKNYYDNTVLQERIWYPCIDLTSYLNLLVPYKDNLSAVSFIFQDVNAPSGTSADDIRYLRFFPIGSQSQLRFLQPNGSNTVIPVLMLTGIETLSDWHWIENNPRIGILQTSVDNGTVSSTINTLVSSNNIVWVQNLSSFNIVYPRIRINSSNLKNSEDELILKCNNNILTNYTNYYVLGRKDTVDNIDVYRYYITIQPEYIFSIGNYGTYKCAYTLTNSGLFMYLDGIQVLKENSYPRVSYSITPAVTNTNFIRIAYKTLNKIVHINDYELKFSNVQGYISELHLKLDSPDDDEIIIENYKTKFEDLFSSIVVQTEQMKKNSVIVGMAAQAFTANGELKTNMVQNVMNRVDLNYAFNNGTLTIDEKNGIWGTSDSGVVAFRGSGIFTATEKDENDNWIWNTGILPSGINASLITTGQLDTNLIRVFAGNDLKFQLNGDGLFAYRSQWNSNDGTIAANTRNDGLDLGQYVVHNSDGLFLTAEAGTIIGEDDDNNPISLQTDVNRVSITWDGLTLRKWDNTPTLWADADTGDLHIKGKLEAATGTFTGVVTATGLYIVNDESSTVQTFNDYMNSFDLINNGTIQSLQEQIDGNITTWFETGVPHPIDSSDQVYNYPAEDWTDAVEKKKHIGDLYYDLETNQCYRWIYEERNNNVINYWGLVKDNEITQAITIANAKAKVFYMATTPTLNDGYNIGDLWIETENGYIDGKQYIAVSKTGLAADWVRYNNKIAGTKFSVDTNTGQIEIHASQTLDLAANGILSITGNGGVTIGSNTAINMYAGSAINMLTNNSNVGLSLNSQGISLMGSTITMNANSNINMTSGSINMNGEGGIYLNSGSSMLTLEPTLFSLYGNIYLNGQRVTTETFVGGKRIYIQTTQPNDVDCIWLKPTTILSVNYSYGGNRSASYTAINSGTPTDFTLSAVQQTTLNTTDMTYTLTIPLRRSSNTSFSGTLAASISKGGATVSLGTQTFVGSTTDSVTFTATTRTNLAGDTGNITLTLTASAYLWLDPYNAPFSLEIKNTGMSGGNQTCSVIYVPPT